MDHFNFGSDFIVPLTERQQLCSRLRSCKWPFIDPWEERGILLNNRSPQQSITKENVAFLLQIYKSPHPKILTLIILIYISTVGREFHPLWLTKALPRFQPSACLLDHYSHQSHQQCWPVTSAAASPWPNSTAPHRPQSGEGDFGGRQVSCVPQTPEDDAARWADHDVGQAGMGQGYAQPRLRWELQCPKTYTDSKSQYTGKQDKTCRSARTKHTGKQDKTCR